MRPCKSYVKRQLKHKINNQSKSCTLSSIQRVMLFNVVLRLIRIANNLLLNGLPIKHRILLGCIVETTWAARARAVAWADKASWVIDPALNPCHVEYFSDTH